MNPSNFITSPHPFLTGMAEAHLSILAEAAREAYFPEGTRIFREGEHAQHFYLIGDGKVGLQTHSAGHPVPIASLGAGEVLGWSWLFPPYCWHYDAWAEEETRGIAFDAAFLRDRCDANNALGYELVRRMAKV